MKKIDTLDIIYKFYAPDSDLCKRLIAHSLQVRDKALRLLENKNIPNIDVDIVSAGAMLHDIGIIHCHAPKIDCVGTEPYLCHGIIGAKMLREYNPYLEPFARICERHTGAGILANEIIIQGLPLPPKDYLPETLEEKIICFADKFFSKSGSQNEKSIESIRKSMAKFGPDVLARFNDLSDVFLH